MGAGFRVFIGLGCEIEGETERETGFKLHCDFIIRGPTQNRKLAKNEPFVRIHVPVSGF